MENKLTQDEAARIIQRSWRRKADKVLFQKLKKLVCFRNQGDPAVLLRVINPVEAQLLDPAVGAHVRFRLGGIEWPPQIYYKIFLHSPVCDVNSYAPRNYVAKDNESIPPISADNINEVAGKQGWYQRVENNGWRPISSLSPSAVDAITQMTSKDSPYKRQKLKPKTKKLKKEVAEIKVKRFLQEKRAQIGDDILPEELLEDEKLYEWVESVDLQKYMEDWDTLGTTGPSSYLWWNNDAKNDIVSSESSDSEIDEEELLKLIE